MSGIGDQPLDALIEQARQGYPATRDPDGSVGKGFNETITHVLNWGISPAGHPEHTQIEQQRADAGSASAPGALTGGPGTQGVARR